ncbi:hypothetical protein KIPB_008094, partial [Kipferlia bialata]
ISVDNDGTKFLASHIDAMTRSVVSTAVELSHLLGTGKLELDAVTSSFQYHGYQAGPRPPRPQPDAKGTTDKLAWTRVQDTDDRDRDMGEDQGMCTRPPTDLQARPNPMPLYNLAPAQLPIQELLSQPIGPVVAEPALGVHWLAVAGCQPLVPENPSLEHIAQVQRRAASVAAPQVTDTEGVVPFEVSSEQQLLVQTVMSAALAGEGFIPVLSHLGSAAGLETVLPVLLPALADACYAILESLLRHSQTAATAPSNPLDPDAKRERERETEAKGADTFAATQIAPLTRFGSIIAAVFSNHSVGSSPIAHAHVALPCLLTLLCHEKVPDGARPGIAANLCDVSTRISAAHPPVIEEVQ